MVWIFAIIVVALVAIIVELLIAYQKRAHDFRVRQDPLRRRIREHVAAMQDATANIRRTATQRLEELGYEATVSQQQSETLSDMIRRAQEETTTAEDEVADEPSVVPPGVVQSHGEPIEPKEEDPRDVLVEALRKRDEVDGHVSSLRRDVEIVRRTVERIEARMARRLRKAGVEVSD